MPLGEQVALEPLEPAEDLVHQPAHLGEVAGARPEVLLEAVLERGGQARLELGRRQRERSTASRARSSAASNAAGETRPSAASLNRSFARSIASSTGSSTRRQ